jgi:hypothetical protein
MLFPYTESRHVELRPAAASDAAAVYDLLFRLGLAGLSMIDTYVEQFGRGKSACFLVHRRDADGGSALVGFSSLSDLTPAGHLQAEVRLLPGSGPDVVAEAHALTTNFAFSMWRTRKVYFHATDPDPAAIGFGARVAPPQTALPQTPQDALPQTLLPPAGQPDGVAAGPLVRAEAVLPAHTFFHGRLWDVHVLAVYREDWDVLGVDLLKQIV